jgi:hypothetical protein
MREPPTARHHRARRQRCCVRASKFAGGCAPPVLAHPAGGLANSTPLWEGCALPPPSAAPPSPRLSSGKGAEGLRRADRRVDSEGLSTPTPCRPLRSHASRASISPARRRARPCQRPEDPRTRRGGACVEGGAAPRARCARGARGTGRATKSRAARRASAAFALAQLADSTARS